MATDFEYEYKGQKLTYTVLDEAAKTCAVKAGTNKTASQSVTGALEIPATASDGTNEYTVTEVGTYAFLKNAELTSVTFPSTLTGQRIFPVGDCPDSSIKP